MSIIREKVKVYDMTCTSCESKVERTLKKLDGVTSAIANFSAQEVIVEYDTELCNNAKIKESIKSAGYNVVKSSSNYKIIGIIIVAAVIIFLGNSTGGFDMNARLNGASYFVLFVVGMLTSIHCVGMCGGIMLSQSINKETTSKFKSIRPAILYNAGRVVAYTVIGGLVGSLGSVLALSPTVKAGLQIFAGVFMVIMGLNMAGFSFFRKFNIKLPWSSCSIKNKPKTPFLVGLLNGLMPCGPLQTMQLYALGTGSATKGALSMLLFSLGTVPLMLTFGALSGLLSKGYTKQILKMSGFLVIILGLIMGSRGLALSGIGIPNVSAITQTLTSTGGSEANIGKAVLKNGIQEITMTVDGSGFTPNAFYVKKGVPVKWIINGDALNSCNNAIVAPSIKKELTLKKGENIIEFTPTDKDINFSCWMGMIRGVIKVTDDLDNVDTSVADSSIPAPSSGMSCCTGGGATGSGASAPQAPSIYGNDLGKVATDVLIKKATSSSGIQTVTMTGKGYEFDPLVVIANKGVKTKLSLDLNSFDNPTGKFEIYFSEATEAVATFDGKKGIVTTDITFSKNGSYFIVKDNSVVAAIDVQDDITKADLEKVRETYIGQ